MKNYIYVFIMSEVYNIAGISSLDSINQDIVSRNNSIRNTNDMNRRQYIKDIGDLRGKVNSADPKFQKVRDKTESLADAGYSAYTGVKVGKGVGATKIGDAISSTISDGIQQGLNTFKSGSARATRRAEFLDKGQDLQKGFELSEIPNIQYANIASRASARPLQGAIAPPQASTARFVGRRTRGEGDFDLFDDEADGAERLNLRPTSQAIDRFLGTSTAQTPAGYGARVIQPPLTFGKESEEREALGTGEEGMVERPTITANDLPSEDVRGTQVGDNAVKTGGDIIKGGGKALSALGKGLAVLNVGQGVYDAGEDILSKGVVGENKNLRTANVLGMVSGGADAISLGAGSIAGALESAGLVADSTGIGAPLGIAMGLVGAGVGVAGAVEDYIGGKKKKQDLQNKLKSAVAKTPAQITPQALATSTAGEVRKVSKGMSVIS